MKTKAETPTETRTINLMLQGLTNREIAYSESVSESAIKLRATNIFKKYSVKGREELHGILKQNPASRIVMSEYIGHGGMPKGWGLRRLGDNLSSTEKKVKALLESKKSTKEMCALLNVKRKTIQFHISNIFRKLGVRSRLELLILHDQSFAPQRTPTNESIASATLPHGRG